MDDDSYLAALREALTGRPWPELDLWRDPEVDLALTSVERVDDGPWVEVEVGFSVAVDGGSPAYGTIREPFDAAWRALSLYDEPDRYARDLAQRVEQAAMSRLRWPAGRPPPPGVPVEAGWAWLQDALRAYGTVREVAPGRLEVTDDRRTVTFLVTPEQWASLMWDVEADPLGLDETIGPRQRDETYVVFHRGGLARSVRAELPPVRGTALEREVAALRARDPGATSWFVAFPDGGVDAVTGPAPHGG